MQSEWFENWFDSPYYHVLYQNRSEMEAQLFVNNCLEILQPKPGETLLDLACGKGRHALAFAKHNLDVTGVDLSKESIIHAQRYEQENLHFFVHDMRNIFRVNYYNYVCNLFTSFGYFQKPNDNLLAAKSIFVSLKPAGIFLIDFVNRNHAIKNIEGNRQETIEKENLKFIINRSFSDKYFIKQIQVKDGQQNYFFQEMVSSFTLVEMKYLFKLVGLTFMEAYGNYNFEAYDEGNSPRMILKFKK